MGKKGKVFLAGAGPGDPELITLKAVRRLNESDCVIYDRLVNKELLKYAKKGASVIYAGKRAGRHTIPQRKINSILIKEAASGKIVTRLKGGDPFVFGRGSEEAQALAEAGIPFEIVSGVTSAVSAPAYAGIPLTDRGISSVCAFVTGQEEPGKKISGIDWRHLAGIKGTLVFLMGVKNIRHISDSLIKNGMPPDTPAAVISYGTLPAQKTHISALCNMHRLKVKPPAVIVVGETVRLREKLSWFEAMPLSGRRILVTREEGKSHTLSGMLRERGAVPVEFPVIMTRPLRDYSRLRRILRSADKYDWLIFTSKNGIKYTMDVIKDIRLLKGPKICAIGPATKKEAERLGVKVEYVPYEYCAAAIVKSFRAKNIRGKKILILRAKKAAGTLLNGLKALGAETDCVPVYETVLPAKINRKPDTISADCITFTSSSTVKNTVKLIPKEAIAKKPVITIGPVTSASCRKMGIIPAAQAEKYTLEGIVEALEKYYDKSHKTSVR